MNQKPSLEWAQDRVKGVARYNEDVVYNPDPTGSWVSFSNFRHVVHEARDMLNAKSNEVIKAQVYGDGLQRLLDLQTTELITLRNQVEGLQIQLDDAEEQVLSEQEE
jgi:hypothetical protein